MSKKKKAINPEVEAVNAENAQEVIKERKPLNVCGHRKIFYIVSIALIVISIVVAICGRLNLAIQFKGGTEITYSYEGEIDTSKVASIVNDAIGQKATVTTGESMADSSKTVTLSFASEKGLTNSIQTKLTDSLQSELKDNKLEVYGSNDVSPSNGKEFFIKCLVAVIFSVIVMIIYIGFRFRKIGGISAGCMAVVALIHDMLMVFGCFVICGFDIDANFMAVLLTILGYSINATIIIYDRIRENKKIYGRKADVDELVNMSVTQTIGRSIHTNVTTIMAMSIVCIVCVVAGVSSIMSFAFPLIIGMLAGVYSSNCIAPTLWVCWQEHRQKKLLAQAGTKKKK